jgi:hypothetical protein
MSMNFERRNSCAKSFVKFDSMKKSGLGLILLYNGKNGNAKR